MGSLGRGEAAGPGRRGRPPARAVGKGGQRQGGGLGCGEERHNAGAVVCLLNELEHLDGGVRRGLHVEVAALAQDPRHR